MQDELIAIKGHKDGLLISLSPTEKWQSITERLAARIDERANFFAGAAIIIECGARPVPKFELSSLKALLERRGLSLSLVLSDSVTTRESALALDLKTDSKTRSPRPDQQETLPVDPKEAGTWGVMVRRTLRSGRIIQSEGHVIVLGDVNPGAKVIAAGDIIVWGKLRGTVHAGADGDESAIVCALEMSPNQLRIAGCIVTPPSGKRRQLKPEMALIRENQIVIVARR